LINFPNALFSIRRRSSHCCVVVDWRFWLSGSIHMRIEGNCSSEREMNMKNASSMLEKSEVCINSPRLVPDRTTTSHRNNVGQLKADAGEGNSVIRGEILANCPARI
jgi:hypothetical protein